MDEKMTCVCMMLQVVIHCCKTLLLSTWDNYNDLAGSARWAADTLACREPGHISLHICHAAPYAGPHARYSWRLSRELAEYLGRRRLCRQKEDGQKVGLVINFCKRYRFVRIILLGRTVSTSPDYSD